MRTRITIIMLVIGGMFVAGCTPSPRAGVVGWAGTTPEGSLAKDIPFTASDGTKTTFHKVRGPIAILVFTSPPADQCCWVSPELVALTNRFEELPISVAQISLPTAKCSHGPGCTEMCRLGTTRLFSFCDTDRIAWKAYNEPKSGTVILIDQTDKIVATGSLDNLKPVTDKAYEMGKRLHESEPDMIYRRLYLQ
jgi:hypothetical protein